VNVVVDVGGSSTLQQSLQAVRRDGLISATGLLGDSPDGKVATILDTIFTTCIARGILLGSRDQFGQMNACIEEKSIKPVLDETVFEFSQMKEAYVFVMEQRHFSKIGIRICEE
jgi:NADPH:quinone reductase-like Zn-dependent oxidoreductase